MTHEADNCARYNYIVHPLAYRVLLNELPDCGVDGIQWSVNNINSSESHFKAGHTGGNGWGTKVNGIELFNDFT